MISSDRQGNIFVAGSFSGTIEAENLKAISRGKGDIFIARISKTGSLEKLFSFGSKEDDYPGSITVDPSGNPLLSGTFSKSFDIGETRLESGSKLVNSNNFIIKLDNNFNVIWTKSLMGNEYASIASIKSDNTGNIYATGSFSSQLRIFDTLLLSKGYTDAFILKLKPDGSRLWSKTFGSWYYDYASSANIDNLGGLIIAGSIGDSLSVDSISIKPVSKENSAVVIQFSPEGKAVWADCISGSGRNFSSGSALDKRGNLYFTGSFQNKFEKFKRGSGCFSCKIL